MPRQVASASALAFAGLIPYCSARDPLVKVETAFHPFGSARYAHQWPTPTWEDFRGHDGRLGGACYPEEEALPCGAALVCRESICRHCVRDSECPSWHTCAPTMSGHNLCIRAQRKAWEEVWYNPWHLFCSIVIFISSIISAAAGTGGGGIFVPMLMLFAGMKTDAAIPLSQCMVMGSSFVNLALFAGQRHPTHPHEAKIDYQCAVRLEPMLCLGVSLGVLAHEVAPDWFMLVLLALTLGLALWRTVRKGLRQWREEAERHLTEKPVSVMTEEEASHSELFNELMEHKNEVLELTNQNSREIIALTFIWLTWFMVSFSRLPTCSLEFKVLISICICGTIAATLAVGKWIPAHPDAAMKWSAASSTDIYSILRFPFVAFLAGWIGGLLGIGGGMIMSPVLLEVGMHSEAVQATTALFVFLSSSLATVQFAIMGRHVWHYVIWYVGATVLATLLGQQICSVVVQKHRRYSLITLSIACVMLLSLLAISMTGIHNLAGGTRWSFSFARLCHGGGERIIVPMD